MPNKFKELFNINNQYQEEYEVYQENLKKERENIVLYKEGDLIWKSELCKHFYGDCKYCSNFKCVNCGTAYEQESCKKYPGIDCGQGHTCKDNDFEGNKGWDEFEKVLKYAEELKNIIDNKVYQASVCRRCGKTHFSLYIGTKEYDGGFTRQNYFEPLPEGWGWSGRIGRLCPTCFEKYQEMEKRFMNNFMEEDK